jgi:hypothetical protein
MSTTPERAAEPQRTADEAALDAAIADFLHRTECGEAITPERFMAAHPHLADALGEYFDADAQFNELLDDVLLEESRAAGPAQAEADELGADLSGVGAFGPQAEPSGIVFPAPAAAEPNVAAPAAAEPNVAEPNVAEPNAAEPQLADRPVPADRSLGGSLGRITFAVAGAGAALLAAAVCWVFWPPTIQYSQPPQPPTRGRPFVDPNVHWTTTPEEWAARPQRLLGHWRLDGAPAGGRVDDLSGAGHHGTVRGSPSPIAGGWRLKAGDWIDLEAPAGLNFDGPITIAAWLQPGPLDSIRNIVAHGFQTAPSAEVFLRIKDGHYEIGSWTGGDHKAAAPIPPSDAGRWVHLAGSFDGRNWQLYHNGRRIAAAPRNVGAVEMRAGWAIASRGGTADRFLDAAVGEVRIYNYALPDDEILALAAEWPAASR